MEPIMVKDMTYDQLYELVKRAIIDGMKEVNRQQTTQQADKVAQLLKG